MFALPLLVFLSFCSLITGYANPPPSGTVDLSGDASDRWTEILSTLLAMHTWDDGLGYVFMRAAEDYETAGCQDACITKLASVFASRYPEQYEELRYSNVSVAGVVTVLIVVFLITSHKSDMLSVLTHWLPISESEMLFYSDIQILL